LAFQPRGIFAYDIVNDSLIWDHPTGFLPYTPKLSDINGDQIEEIIVGSDAPDNGAGELVNGTDDRHTYLTILDLQGNKIFQQQLGIKGTHLTIFLHDVDFDGVDELYLAQSGIGTNSFDLWEWVMKSKKMRMNSTLPRETVLCEESVFLDVEKDGICEVIIGWEDGLIEVVSNNLQKLFSRRFIDFVPYFLKLSDLNNDGADEIIVSGSFKDTSLLMVLDCNLNLLALLDHQNSFTPRFDIFDIGYGEHNLILTRSNNMLKFMEFNKRNIIYRLYPSKEVSLGFLIGILVSVILVRVTDKRKKSKQSLNVISRTFEDIPMGLMLLDPNGRVLITNRLFNKMLDLDDVYECKIEFPKYFANDHILISNVIEEFKREEKSTFTRDISLQVKGKILQFILIIKLFSNGDDQKSELLVCLQDITDLAKSNRAMAWAKMAQKLAHEIKTPLSTVMLSAQRLKELCENEKDKTDVYLTNITEEVNRLRSITDALIRFAKVEKPRFGSINVNELISKLIQNNLIRFGTDISPSLTCTDDIPHIIADESQLITVLQNIIDNSLSAIYGKGNINISTRLVQSLQSSTQMIEIEIADSGIGIPDENIGELFQPFYSTFKSGNGLGLTIVKKIIEDHCGEIRINSKENLGTTVIITLPVDNEYYRE